MSETRERRAVFGEAVDAYEAARPGYPDELVQDVLDHAQLDGAPVLEVGAGTGKASLGFARRGLALTCLEPDARMAEVLVRNCARYPRTEVVVSGFEQWPLPAERFGLLFSAQAWHWVDPASRWSLGFDALRPGGTVALFWNQFSVDDVNQRSALAEAHSRHGASEFAPATLGRPRPASSDPADDWPASDLLADDRYRDVRTRAYTTTHGFTTDRYVNLLASISNYRMLEDARREALLADVAETLAGFGGSFELTAETHLYLARTRS